MEIIETTAGQLPGYMQDCIAAGLAPMIWGDPGIGKSEIAAQVARATGRVFYDVRLSIMESTDLSGYIVLHGLKAGAAPKFTAPACLPPSDLDQPSLLMLDEIVSASRELQAAAYQLVWDRRANGYSLPADCAVCAAGNLASSRGVVNSMPTPLKNRFVHFLLVPDLPSWLTWAMASGIDPRIIAYHHFDKNGLMVFDPRSDDMAFASPRSWVMLSRLLAVNPRPSMAQICGTIGQGVGAQFAGFLAQSAYLATAEEIFAQPDTAPVPDSEDGRYMVCASLAASVVMPTLAAMCTYLARMPSQDYAVMAMDIATKRDRNLVKAPGFVKWGIEHSYVLGISDELPKGD